MNFKLVASALVLGCGLAAAPGCAVTAADAGSEGDSAAEAEKAETSEDALHQHAAALAGAFHGDFHAGTQLPAFDGIVFKADGTFFADVNTGIVCITTPCPTQARISGRFFATRSYIYLSSVTGDLSNGVGSMRGWYRYSHSPGYKLSLERPWHSHWQQSLAPEQSYCSQPVDCEGQGIIHIMCAGQWTCGAGAANQCGYSCGIPGGNAVWPTNATKLVAHNAGGGFTPPPPPGSNCAVGMSKYTLDVATSGLDWEECSFIDWNTPMTLTTGHKVLSAAETAKVNAAMNGVTIAQDNICGADKPFMTLEITSPAGTKKYTDSFYSCMGAGPFVDNIDGVFGAMRNVAH